MIDGEDNERVLHRGRRERNVLRADSSCDTLFLFVLCGHEPNRKGRCRMRVFSTCCVIVALHVSSGCSPSSPQATKGGNEVRNEHKVVSVVHEFLKYIENSDYDHAIELGTQGEFTRDGLAKFGKVFDLSQARVVEAYLGKKHAAVMTNPIPRRAEDRTTQMGYSLLKSGDRWLIRDSDRLPDEQWVQKWLAGFRSVEPDAEEL